MGVSKYLKEQNPDIQIVGLQPEDGASIVGIRRWPPEEYLPTIFDRRVDRIIDIPQLEAERPCVNWHKWKASVRELHLVVQCGHAKIAEETPRCRDCVHYCDRGDRYLSTGLFSVQDEDQNN